jgi:hypothetical protein
VRDLPDVSVVMVRDRPADGGGPSRADLALPSVDHEVVLLVERLDRSVIKALRYALGIDASHVRAVHAAADPHAAEQLAEAWAEAGQWLGVPLDVEACFDRNVVASITASVERSMEPGVPTTVVLPRRDSARVVQRLLHDRTSRRIARALADLPDVELVVVPYRIGGASTR